MAQTEVGLVDASVTAVAERLKVVAIATTNRRHFEPLRAARRLKCDLVP